MISTTPAENDQFSLESQNLPRCMHSEIISQFILDAVDGKQINIDKLTNTLNFYLEDPVLLDPFIGNWTRQLTSKLNCESLEDLQVSCQILYQLCKIKGYKSIIKYFPNSVIELPKIVNNTIQIVEKGEELYWTCRYIFLLWISLLIQCPFDLKRVFKNDFEGFYIKFVNEIVRNQFLKGSSDKPAAVLMAALLKRPSESVELLDFLNWSASQGPEYSIGVLMTLVQLGKMADDPVLMANFDKINEILINLSSFEVESMILNKLILKLRARLTQIQVKLGLAVQLNPFLSTLKHRDTVIRWTAAKALRRILSFCPQTAVLNSLLSQLNKEFNSPMEASPHALHGLFLAIGQLLNYRLIPKFEDKEEEALFVKLLIGGLKFDQIKGSYAVGSFVRDAVCYVTWSLARYSNHLIEPSMDHDIISGLTCMALFDREVSGRRAASAALQEFIGRIGGVRQGPYLQILTHVHFFSVSSLEKSFSSNSLEIAKDLPQFIPDLIAHLLQVSLYNFDKNVRNLAAETLGNLFNLTEEDRNDLPTKLIKIHQESDDIFAIHGSLLSMAALPCDPTPRILEISLQSDRIPIKSLGADLLLDGYLRLISSVSLKSEASVESINECLKGWFQAVTSGLKSRLDDLRNTAVSALQYISCKYGKFMENFYIACLVGVEKERDVNYQKGLLSALSTSPETFFSKHGSVLIKLLLKTAKTTIPINDIEKRCVAIESLNTLLQTYKSFEIVDQESIKECIISSLLCDYSIDTRGDVGSKVRFAAFKLSENFPKCPEIDDLILEQAFGRLDKLRIPAINSIFPNESLGIDEFALRLLETTKNPLKGTFRGLIFSCGGLDPEMTEKASNILKQYIVKWGSYEFEQTALSAINEERLCIPSILSVNSLQNILSNEFIEIFSDSLIDSVILKTSNIRKLIPSFNLLIHVNKVILIGKYSDFLDDQCTNHKFPAIRHLIDSCKKE